MKMKVFDCVEMQHRGAEKIRAKIRVMTQEEELAFWQERSKALQQRLKRAEEQHNAQENE